MFEMGSSWRRACFNEVSCVARGSWLGDDDLQEGAKLRAYYLFA